MKNQTLKNNRGFAALIAMILVGMLTLIGLASLSTTDDEITITGNEVREIRAFNAAEALLDKAAAELHVSYDLTGTVPSLLPSGTSEMNDCIAAYNTTDDGPAIQKVLSRGTLAGLHALVKSYTINSIGVNNEALGKVELSQHFEAALVPLFQFAVFYDNDLEIAPGPTMSLIGRVHSNGNMWLQSNNSLKIDSCVTAAGNIFHGRKGAGSVSNGDILVKNGDGNYTSMKEGSGWLESTDAHWIDSSIARWNGRVQDADHGQSRLNLPLTDGSGNSPHSLIERETDNPDSYESKASLKFINGKAYQLIGTVWSNVTNELTAKGIITKINNKFYDGRDKIWVDVTELDMNLLYSEGYAPANGVVYFSDKSGDFPALRIRNGAELDAPLTIASENPVYTLGDFNSVNKKPACIMGDAVTFLSSAFNDANSDKSKNDRIAVATKVNASILTGNVETTASNYNGGFENLPRFLEKWSNKKFTWTGSMVNLWYSQQANSTWNGTYYSPPIRDWSYDIDLDDPTKLPPETPMVRVFQRTGWKMAFDGFEGQYTGNSDGNGNGNGKGKGKG